MTKKLIIPFSERIPKTGGSKRFDFLGNNGKNVPLHKLFGKTTTWPDWTYGLTREVNGETWWIIKATNITHTGTQIEYTHIDQDNNILGTLKTHDIPIHHLTTLEQRALIEITSQEAQTLGHPHQKEALAIREDSEAWKIFTGEIKDNKIPITLSLKTINNKINTYLAKQQDTNTTQPKKGIQKITNYTPVKVMNKINEIIEYINKNG